MKGESVKFSIRTKDHQHSLLANTPIETGTQDVAIRVLNSRHTAGISESELLINIAISIGTGISSGIAANWIFVKLGLGRDTRLNDQFGALISTVKQLEEKLDDLMKSQRKA
jgi:hypothetical protein